jgi:hypothetical protein
MPTMFLNIFLWPYVYVYLPYSRDIISEIVLLIASYKAFPRNQRDRRSPTSVCWLNTTSDGCQQLKSYLILQNYVDPLKKSYDCITSKLLVQPLGIDFLFLKSKMIVQIFSGGRPEGSKRNLKFQSAMWHHLKHFQRKAEVY